MEVSIATLLLLTASVVLACICVTYAVNIVQQTINATNLPDGQRIQSLINGLDNSTNNALSGTMPGSLPLPSPTP